MSVPSTPADLLDLKMMPAWVNEPAERTDYSNYKGEDEQSYRREGRGAQRGGEDRPRGPRPQGRRDDTRRGDDRKRPDRRPEQRRTDSPPRRFERREAPVPLPDVGVRFLPHAGAFESVTAQIKAGPIAYSVFALARLFLEKPERYDVRVSAAEGAVLHQLGEHGPVAVDPRILENGAFGSMREEFYTIEETESEPIKGNFTNVARDRVSGTLLGPTNHHNYQPQLRGLYEQRFSRRMSFQDFQRQIEIVSDPAVVEQWKEQARKITKYVAKETEPPLTFNNLGEAERHFRQTHLPTLLRSAQQLTVSGVLSRQLPDRALGQVIENAWAMEIRSPSHMMQELAGGLRQAGLNIFRHRRGMLFVSPVRTRVFGHERGSVSASVNAILAKVSENAGINRKQLAEQLAPADAEAIEQERAKRTLASDLRWLISEGYVIEFNDGTLDLPRAKAPAAQAAAGAPSGEQAMPVEEDPSAANSAADLPAAAEAEISGAHAEGGMSVEQSIEPLAPESAASPGESTSPENMEAGLATAADTSAQQLPKDADATQDAQLSEEAVPSPS